MQTLDQTEDSLFQEPAHKAQVLVFTSGKASVGKTSIVANVAVSLTKKGAKVCVIDASIGYDNINMVLDIQPEYTFEQVLTGNKSVAEIINTSATGVSVVSGVASLVTATNLGEIERRNFLTALADIETAYDYVLIDIPAGVTENLLQVIESAPYAFMV